MVQRPSFTYRVLLRPFIRSLHSPSSPTSKICFKLLREQFKNALERRSDFLDSASPPLFHVPSMNSKTLNLICCSLQPFLFLLLFSMAYKRGLSKLNDYAEDSGILGSRNKKGFCFPTCVLSSSEKYNLDKQGSRGKGLQNFNRKSSKSVLSCGGSFQPESGDRGEAWKFGEISKSDYLQLLVGL